MSECFLFRTELSDHLHDKRIFIRTYPTLRTYFLSYPYARFSNFPRRCGRDVATKSPIVSECTHKFRTKMLKIRKTQFGFSTKLGGDVDGLKLFILFFHSLILLASILQRDGCLKSMFDSTISWACICCAKKKAEFDVSRWSKDKTSS